MYPFWIVLFAAIALLWITQGLRAMAGVYLLPRLPDVAPAPDAACPGIAVLFAARDEAQKLPRALETILAQDYPRLKIVAADDRSRDATGEILDQAARTDPRLRVLHVAELPPGWLGKPHALQKAYEHSGGEWLVFTDADVHFAPDLLRRAIALAQQRGWDHLTLLADLEFRGFWEKTAVTYFGLGFVLGQRPWLAQRKDSRCYVGVGAFQLLRRSAYESIGTHRRLAMEIIDDMKLGKHVKLGGFRSGVAVAGPMLRVRWHDGLRNIIRGVTKNMFAACGYRPGLALLTIAATFAISILPFLALPFAAGLPRAFASVAAVAAIVLHGALTRTARLSPLYALTHPLGAAIFCYMMARSMGLTLWRGGVVWRDTFYPLEELKRGLVPQTHSGRKHRA